MDTAFDEDEPTEVVVGRQTPYGEPEDSEQMDESEEANGMGAGDEEQLEDEDEITYMGAMEVALEHDITAREVLEVLGLTICPAAVAELINLIKLAATPSQIRELNKEKKPLVIPWDGGEDGDIHQMRLAISILELKAEWATTDDGVDAAYCVVTIPTRRAAVMTESIGFRRIASKNQGKHATVKDLKAQVLTFAATEVEKWSSSIEAAVLAACFPDVDENYWLSSIVDGRGSHGPFTFAVKSTVKGVPRIENRVIFPPGADVPSGIKVMHNIDKQGSVTVQKQGTYTVGYWRGAIPDDFEGILLDVEQVQKRFANFMCDMKAMHESRMCPSLKLMVELVDDMIKKHRTVIITTMQTPKLSTLHSVYFTAHGEDGVMRDGRLTFVHLDPSARMIELLSHYAAIKTTKEMLSMFLIVCSTREELKRVQAVVPEVSIVPFEGPCLMYGDFAYYPIEFLAAAMMSAEPSQKINTKIQASDTAVRIMEHNELKGLYSLKSVAFCTKARSRPVRCIMLELPHAGLVSLAGPMAHLSNCILSTEPMSVSPPMNMNTSIYEQMDEGDAAMMMEPVSHEVSLGGASPWMEFNSLGEFIAFLMSRRWSGSRVGLVPKPGGATEMTMFSQCIMDNFINSSAVGLHPGVSTVFGAIPMSPLQFTPRLVGESCRVKQALVCYSKVVTTTCLQNLMNLIAALANFAYDHLYDATNMATVLRLVKASPHTAEIVTLFGLQETAECILGLLGALELRGVVCVRNTNITRDGVASNLSGEVKHFDVKAVGELGDGQPINAIIFQQFENGILHSVRVVPNPCSYNPYTLLVRYFIAHMGSGTWHIENNDGVIVMIKGLEMHHEISGDGQQENFRFGNKLFK